MGVISQKLGKKFGVSGDPTIQIINLYKLNKSVIIKVKLSVKLGFRYVGSFY